MRSLVFLPFALATALVQAQLPQPDLTACYGLHPQQCYDLFRSPVASVRVPLVVLVHPGAWWTGDKACSDGQGTGVCRQAGRLRDRSFATASLNYRYTVQPGQTNPGSWTPLTAQRDDVYEAVKHLIDNADAYGIDPERVFLWGMSGGAYLASAAALQGGLPARGIVHLFGPTTFGYRPEGPRLAWDQDIADQCGGQLCNCNPGWIVPPLTPCNQKSHPGYFCTSAVWKSMVSALVGCTASDPLCNNPDPPSPGPVEQASLDRTATWTTNAPPPFVLIHHTSDCTVPLRQVSRLAQALGPARAELHEFESLSGHGYDDALDSPIVDAFLDRYVNWRAAGTGDFDGDGKTDVTWQDPASGVLRLWLMNGTSRVSTVAPTPDSYGSPADLDKIVLAVADFNSDGRPDLLWRDRKTGDMKVWLMNGSVRVSEVAPTPAGLADLNWSLGGAADFDNDGKPDLLWRHRVTGKTVVWFMNGVTRSGAAYTTPDLVKDLQWGLAGVGRFDATDGQTDVLWRHTATGATVVSKMNGTSVVGELTTSPTGLADLNWRFVGVGDFDADVDPDWLWQNWLSDRLSVWFFDDLVRTGATFTTPDMAPKAP